MKITFTNPSSQRVEMKVWHNDTEYSMHDGELLKLDVKRGDRVSYQVGKMSSVRDIKYQSPDATFNIALDKRAQLMGFTVIFAVILVLYFMKLLDSTLIATITVAAALIAYEAINYFGGYKANVVHS